MTLHVRLNRCKLFPTEVELGGSFPDPMLCFVPLALLNILVARLEEKQPELLEVSEDMPDIAAASALCLGDINSEVQQLESGAASVQQELITVGKEVAAAHRAPLSAQDLKRLGATTAVAGSTPGESNNDNSIDVDDKKKPQTGPSITVDTSKTEWTEGYDITLAKSCRDTLVSLGAEVGEVVTRQRNSTCEMESSFASLLKLYGEEPSCSLRYGMESWKLYELRFTDLFHRFCDSIENVPMCNAAGISLEAWHLSSRCSERRVGRWRASESARHDALPQRQ